MYTLASGRSPIAPWVKRLTEEVLGAAPFAVGDIVLHPSGRQVKIISGYYWTAGGFSNHWKWQEIMPDDSLSPVIETGYGWSVRSN